MGASAILATIRAALEAVPLIAKELENLRGSIDRVRNDRLDFELAALKSDLNKLTMKLATTEDKNEMARIIERLNSL